MLVSEAQEVNLSGTFRLFKYKRTTEAEKQNKTKQMATKNTHKAESINLQEKEIHDSKKINWIVC